MKSSKVRFDIPYEKEQRLRNQPIYTYSYLQPKRENYTSPVSKPSIYDNAYNKLPSAHQIADSKHRIQLGPSPLSHLNLPPCPLPRHRKHQSKKKQKNYNIASHKYGVFEHGPSERTTITNSYKKEPHYRSIENNHFTQQQQPRPPSLTILPRNRHMVPHKQYMCSKEVLNEIVSRMTIPPPPTTLAPSLNNHSSAIYSSNSQSPEELLRQLKQKLKDLDRIVNEEMVSKKKSKSGLADIQETDELLESEPQSPTSPFSSPRALNSPKDEEINNGRENKENNFSKKPPLPPNKITTERQSSTERKTTSLERKLSLPKQPKSSGKFSNLSRLNIVKTLSNLQLNKNSYDVDEHTEHDKERLNKRRLSSISSFGFFNLKNRWNSLRWSFTNFKTKNKNQKVGKKLTKRQSLTSLFSSWSSNLASCARAPKEDDDDDDEYIDVSVSGENNSSISSECFSNTETKRRKEFGVDNLQTKSIDSYE